VAHGDGDGGDGDPIKKYRTSFKDTKVTFLVAEEVGFGGTFNVSGGVRVDIGESVTNINVGVTAKTAASIKGDISWGGTVDIYDGNKLINSYQLKDSGNTLYDSRYTPVGQIDVNITNVSDLKIKINVGYIFTNGVNRAASSQYSKTFKFK
jgi:hypothetical protein